MSASYVNAGAVADGTTSLAVAWPASPAADNLISLITLNKNPPNVPSTPGSFTLVSMATGGEGDDALSDQGAVNIGLWQIEASGSESGTQSVTVASAGVSQGVMLQFSKSDGTWDTAFTSAAEETPGVTWDVTFGSDIGFIAGDIAVVTVGSNTNSNSSGVITSPTLTIPGCTVGSANVVAAVATSTGRDQHLHVSYHSISAGASSGAGSWTATGMVPSATATSPTGVVGLYRIRAVAVATGTTLTGPSGGAIGVASSNFTVGVTPVGGTITGTVTVTMGDGSDGGTFTPTTVDLTTASPTATFTYTPDDGGTKTISITDDGGLADAASVSYIAGSSSAAVISHYYRSKG